MEEIFSNLSHKEWLKPKPMASIALLLWALEEYIRISSEWRSIWTWCISYFYCFSLIYAHGVFIVISYQ